MTPARKPDGWGNDGRSVSAAARWLATTPDNRKPRPIVPHLRRVFGLTPTQAAAAIREAALIRARAH